VDILNEIASGHGPHFGFKATQAGEQASLKPSCSKIAVSWWTPTLTLFSQKNYSFFESKFLKILVLIQSFYL